MSGSVGSDSREDGRSSFASSFKKQLSMSCLVDHLLAMFPSFLSTGLLLSLHEVFDEASREDLWFQDFFSSHSVFRVSLQQRVNDEPCSRRDWRRSRKLTSSNLSKKRRRIGIKERVSPDQHCVDNDTQWPRVCCSTRIFTTCLTGKDFRRSIDRTSMSLSQEIIFDIRQNYCIVKSFQFELSPEFSDEDRTNKNNKNHDRNRKRVKKKLWLEYAQLEHHQKIMYFLLDWQTSLVHYQITSCYVMVHCLSHYFQFSYDLKKSLVSLFLTTIINLCEWLLLQGFSSSSFYRRNVASAKSSSSIEESSFPLNVFRHKHVLKCDLSPWWSLYRISLLLTQQWLKYLLVRVAEDKLAELEVPETDSIRMAVINYLCDLMEELDCLNFWQLSPTSNIRVKISMRRRKDYDSRFRSNKDGFDAVDSAIAIHSKVTREVVMVTLGWNDLLQ